MKKIFLLLSFILSAAIVFGQSTVPIRADTVKIEKVGGVSNLQVQGYSRSTHGMKSAGDTAHLQNKDTGMIQWYNGAYWIWKLTGGTYYWQPFTSSAPKINRGLYNVGDSTFSAYNVTDVFAFSAVGNNSTDNLTPFTNANAVGKPVVINAGTYFVSNDFTFTVPVQLREGAVIRMAGGKVLTFSKTASLSYGQHFHDTTNVLFNQKSVRTVEAIWWIENYQNSGTDSWKAFQTSINSAIKSKIGRMDWPVGTFVTTKMLNIWRDDNADGQPDFVQLTIIGGSRVYGAAQTNGGETVIQKAHKDGPGINIQRSKGTVIENVTVLGQNPIDFTMAQIINPTTNWNPAGLRTNTQSPDCGFSVDGIGRSSISAGNRYPGFESYYDGVVSNGGSSSVQLFNCKTSFCYVGIIINPHGTTQNADLTKIIGCWFDHSEYGIATGESQTRSTYVDHCNSWGTVRILFDSRTFGAGTGAAVKVNDINIAGGLKFLANITGFFPHQEFSNIYAELIYSLGGDLVSTAPASTVSFKDCYFNFVGGADAGTAVPPLILRASTANFYDCQILSYASALSIPFNVRADAIHVVGGRMYGKFWDVKRISNGGTYNSEQFTYQNVQIIGSYKQYTDNIVVQALDQIQGNNAFLFMGGFRWDIPHKERKQIRREYFGYEFDLSRSNGYAYYTSVGAIVVVDSQFWKYGTTAANIAKTAVGDYVWMATSAGGNISMPEWNESGTPIVGYVYSISGDSVTVKGKLHGAVNGTSYMVGTTNYKKIKRMAFGDIASGSPTITNVYSESNSGGNPFQAGDRIDHPSIPFGAYVVSVTSTTITLSANATATEANAALNCTPFKARYVLESPSDAGLLNGIKLGYKKGDLVYNDLTTNTDVVYWICTGNGIINGATQPTFQAVYKTAFPSFANDAAADAAGITNYYNTTSNVYKVKTSSQWEQVVTDVYPFLYKFFAPRLQNHYTIPTTTVFNSIQNGMVYIYGTHTGNLRFTTPINNTSDLTVNGRFTVWDLRTGKSGQYLFNVYDLSPTLDVFKTSDGKALRVRTGLDTNSTNGNNKFFINLGEDSTVWYDVFVALEIANVGQTFANSNPSLMSTAWYAGLINTYKGTTINDKNFFNANYVVNRVAGTPDSVMKQNATTGAWEQYETAGLGGGGGVSAGDKIDVNVVTPASDWRVESASGAFAWLGIITPTQITADQNDYAPTGNTTATTFRISSNAARSITGITGGTNGRHLILFNVGSFSITLPNENAGSVAANRFKFGYDISIPAGHSIVLNYDNTQTRWVAAGAPSSAFIQGGNAFGAAGVIGTLDNNVFDIKTNNTNAIRVQTDGTISVGTNADDAAKIYVVGGNIRLDNGSYRIGSTGNGLVAQASTVGLGYSAGRDVTTAHSFGLSNTYQNSGVIKNFVGFDFSMTNNSSTQTIRGLNLIPTINNTGGTTKVQAIYFNPILTSVTNTDLIFLHGVAGRSVLQKRLSIGDSTDGANMLGVYGSMLIKKDSVAIISSPTAAQQVVIIDTATGLIWRTAISNIGSGTGSTPSVTLEAGSTATATVANTTTKTTLVPTSAGSTNVEAAHIVAGSVTKIIAKGLISTAATAGQPTFEFTLGAYTLGSITFTTLANSLVNSTWTAYFEVHHKTIAGGGAGTIEVYMFMSIDNNGVPVNIETQLPTTVTNNTDMAADFQVQWNTASTSNSVKCSSFRVYTETVQ